MNYEVGKQYEMRTAGIHTDSAGYDYIALHDDDPNKEYRVYNILKYQREDLPETVPVIVKSIDITGKIKLWQDEGALNKEHYEVNKLYAFEVTDIKEDYKTHALYYVLEDDYNAHRFYFNGEQKYQIGGDCILQLDGFTKTGFLQLVEPKQTKKVVVEQSSVPKVDNTESRLAESQWSQLPVLAGYEEGQNVEFKTSIAFSPESKGEADIDKQLRTIIKVLASFMNANGGTLFIGVHDKTQKVTGISDDYAHLNDGEDQYNGNYQSNHDGYQLKIRNTLTYLCQGVAGSLIDINFEELKGVEYCKITVKPAKRPIYINGKELYVRQGNRNKLFTNDDLTFFIYDKMRISIQDVLDLDEWPKNNVIDEEKLKHAFREIMNERSSIPNLPAQKPLNEVDHWVTWYQDGTWKRTREKIEDANIHIQLPVYTDTKATLLAFCYENGRVNTVEWKKFRSKTNMKVLQTKKPWNEENGKPKNIFLMLPTDFLVGYCLDSDGVLKVKLHSILDYSTNDSSKAKGAPFLPDDCCIKTYAVIGSEHKKKVAHLIVSKAKRSSDPGTPLNTANASLRDEIEYLNKVLTQS